MRIQALEHNVINQIAAGEVIERPASVVKELLENSIDAGSRAISIQIAGYGKQSITVSDDGAGIHPDDLVLSITSHATSKLSQLSDLATIHSLGFRGEALASISSVSRFSMVSRCEQLEQAFRLEIQSGSPVIGPSNREHGTTIVVRDLFYNTPARRKFLRSDKTELALIEMVVRRIALSYSEVGIELRHGDKRLLYAPPASRQGLKKRLEHLLSKSFLEHSHQLEAQATGLSLHGYISDADFFRSQNDQQFFYLNQRFIKDRLINHAINSAYQDILYQGRYPGYVLYLTLDADEFDINVHPTKQEVRFYQPRLIHDFIIHSVQQRLAPRDAEQPIQERVFSAGDYVTNTEPLSTQTNVADVSTLVTAQTTLQTNVGDVSTVPPQAGLNPTRAASLVRETAASYGADEPSAPPAKVIGQCFQQTVLLEAEDDLIVLNCLQLKREFAGRALEKAYQQQSLVAKSLLVPAMQDLTTAAVTVLTACQPSLLALGIEIDILVSSVVLRKLPSVLVGVNSAKALQAIEQFCRAHKLPWCEAVNHELLSSLVQQIDAQRLRAEITGLVRDFFALPKTQQRKLAMFLSKQTLNVDD
jgi:DNA mismatch repair protein MutL